MQDLFASYGGHPEAVKWIPGRITRFRSELSHIGDTKTPAGWSAEFTSNRMEPTSMEADRMPWSAGGTCVEACSAGGAA